VIAIIINEKLKEVCLYFVDKSNYTFASFGEFNGVIQQVAEYRPLPSRTIGDIVFPILFSFSLSCTSSFFKE